MKKNFTFLFALFLMFAGTANVFADAYPFKITTDPENPELYAIKSGRGDAYWWTYDVVGSMISLKSYEDVPAQYWYFMEVNVDGTAYLQLFPYLGEGKAASYQDTNNGANKIFAKLPGTNGWSNTWKLVSTNGGAPYGLQTPNGATYLSHNGGGANYMGMWSTGPSGDGGTAMYFQPVDKEVKNLSALVKSIKLSDISFLQEKYGLVQETSKFYCNVPQTNEGSLDNLLDGNYTSYFHSAWHSSLAKPEYHYLQAEVSKPVDSFVFYFKKRHNNNNNRPTKMTILGSNDNETYTEITNINSGFPTEEATPDYLSEIITASEPYKYFRFVVNETNNNAKCGDYPFFTFSEFYILPGDETIFETQNVVKEMAQNALSIDAENVFAESVVNAFEAVADAYMAGKDITAPKAAYDEIIAFAGSDDLFTAVVDEASLAANKRYLVVAEGEEGIVALSKQHNGATPYRLQAGVAEMAGVVKAECAANVEEIENLPYMIALESAGEGVWKLKDVVNNAYLHWTEKRSIELDEVGSTWKISIKENGEAEIKLVGKDRTLRYGDEDNRFACYTIGQNAIKLYEDAAANEFFVAFAQFGAVAETCTSLYFINAVSEKFMTVAETVEAMYPNATSLPENELASAVAAMKEVAAYAWEMDAKYQEFVVALQNCYDYLDNSAAPGKIAAAYLAVVDKYIAYQWGMPATTVADIDAYIAEMAEASYVYALAATPSGDFQFDNIVNVESEWVGTSLSGSTTAYLYNTAAKSFLGSANSWGTQVSFLENGYKWTVSSETLCDLEWLFDGVDNVCAASSGDIDLVPHKWVGKGQAPVPFAEGEDNGIEQTAEGIFLPKTTSLFLPLNEKEDLASYTLVYDLRLADVVNFTSLYQTNLGNNANNDGELFIAKNMLGISRQGHGYAGKVEADTWHKIVVVVKDGFITTYIDGLYASSSTKSDFSWVIDKKGVFFFLDNDGESTDIEVAGIQLWKKSLTEMEVAQLCGLETIKGEEVPARTAAWTFDDANNLYANSVGNIALAPYKVGADRTAPVAFEAGEDTGVTVIENGIALPKTTCLFMELNEENDLANYTLVYDFKAQDVSSYISMLQADLSNTSDGDLFVNKGQVGLGGNPGYGGTIEANKWYRLAFVVNNGLISIYVDGKLVISSTNNNNNRWIISKDGAFLFLDEDGEHKALEVGGIQFWNQALTAAHIKAMGAAFDADAPTEVEVPAVAAPTYIIRGPLCHPSDPNKCHIGSNGYADQLPTDHVITRVGQNLYTIQQGNQYYAYKAGTTVLQKVNQLDESCYWQFVTAEELRSKYADATYDAPVNATFEIPGQNFGYNNTETKEWTGSATFGGEWANFVAYKENTETCEMATVLRNMPNGVYRLKVQGFYRQGTTPIDSSVSEEERASAVTARENGTEIAPAKFFANGDSVTVMNILDCAGMNTTSTHGVVYGQYGKAPHGANDASIYFNLGLYEHTMVFTLEEGVDTIKIGLAKNGGVAKDWIVMDNYRLEYLGTTKEVSYFGEITQLTEGEKYVYYTDEAGKKHYLYAAGDANWVVVDEPTTIKFTQGNTTGFATAASFMESNGRYMSNAENGDGTGRINTQAVDGQYGAQLRTWESQVFYKNHANKYAIRLTNSTGTSWGCHCFVNINPTTFEISSGNPSLANELYLWEIEDVVPQDIQEVEVTEVANRAYYTLGGVPVDAPVKGVNIVKTTYTNGKVDIQKIYVK